MAELTGFGVVFLLLGAVGAVLGWAAWTGRYRSWAARGLGYRT